MTEQAQHQHNTHYTATYSPEDNKLRLYTSHRLDNETYQRIKSAGFRWAPKQDLFVAPTWTPERHDLLLELCGEIDDEQMSLEERAELRAERFGGYRHNRLRDAESAHTTAKTIADGIPFGQPILVGHHSEKRARRDAQKIENNMRKAVSMWETAEYWSYRAKGVLRHAVYKDLPGVRARRIKKLEAEKRKFERYIAEAEKQLALWMNPNIELTRERAMNIANYSHVSKRFTLAEYPRDDSKSQYEGSMSVWSALDHEIIDAEEAKRICVKTHVRTIEHYTRWVDHTTLRLTYEMQVLEAQGKQDLIKPKARPKQAPLLNYRQPAGFDIPNEYSNTGQLIHYPMVELTKAQYNAIPSDYKGGKLINGTHRIRVAHNIYFKDKLPANASRYGYSYVFLVDSKEHDKPDASIEVVS